MTPAETGDDAVGTLTIGAGDLIVATNVTLRGADVEISPAATVFGASGNYLAATLEDDNGPDDLAFDSNGNLFASNDFNNTVDEFKPGSTTPDVVLTGVNNPNALAIDKSGNVYVANTGNDTVSVFAPGSTTPTSTLIGLATPVALVFDASGSLYVSNRSNNTISIFAPGSLTPTSTISNGEPHSLAPDSLAFDNNGNLYVTDTFTNSAYKILAGQSHFSQSYGAALPVAVAVDSSGNVYVANGDNNTVNEYSPNGGNPIAVYAGQPNPSDIVIDPSGNLYVSYWGGSTVYKFTPGSTKPADIFTGLIAPLAMKFDASGNLFVANYDGNISEFTLATPVHGSVTILPSLPSLPMSIGGNNNAAVTGVNLTSAEFAAIAAANGGSIVFGSSSQTGNITFSAGAAATALGANIVALQSPSGPGAIILDDGGGSGTALNANGGTVSLTAGSGGIQAGSVPDNVAEIAGATTINLTSQGGIGTIKPLELACTVLNTDTTASNGNQFVNSIGLIRSGLLNAGTGTIMIGGSGGLQLSPTNNNGSILIVDGSTLSGITVGTGQTLKGNGFTGPLSVQSGGSLFSSTTVSNFSSASLNLQAGALFNATLNSTGNYSSDFVISTGTVSLGGANLAISGVLIPANGQSFLLVNNAGSQPVSGTFNGLPEGAVIPNFMGSSLTATISYVGGDGNDIVLNVGSGATTTTTVTASAATATYGQSVTLTATVTANAGTPMGTVEFFNPATGSLVGSGILQSSGAGTATWTYKTTPTQFQVVGGGTYNIEAFFTSLTGFFLSEGVLAGAITIAPATLTVSNVTGHAKIYDQTTVATINTSSAALVGVVSGDNVTLQTNGVSGTFASKNVGLNIVVTVAGLSLTGPQAANYVLIQPKTKANIAPAEVDVTGITANNKIYNGLTSASLNLGNAVLTGVFPGDTVTLSATGQFQSRNVGTMLVSISLTLTGSQASNYTPLLVQGRPMASITPATVTVTGIFANNKIYDGTSVAALNVISAAAAGFVSGDSVSLVKSAAVGTFTSPNVGNNITVNVSGLTLSGNQASNYALTQPATTANITARPLTIMATTNTKTYDSTASAAATPSLSGLAVSDSVTGLAEVYANTNAGSSKILSVSAYTINDGNNGKNYTVTRLTNTTGVISKANLTITATADTKTYDSTLNAAALPTVSGLIGNDSVTGLSELYDSANAGSGKTLSVNKMAPISAVLTGLHAPRVQAFDSSGNLYVANSGSDTVSKFVPGATTPSATLTGLNLPLALVFDGSGNLYVVNGGNSTVSKFAPGATIPSATLTGLNSPDALAFDSSGNLYVANQTTNGTVSVFAPGSTTPSATLTGVNSPGYLIFDSSGNLYVSNTTGNTVSKFAPGSTTPSATLTGLSSPLAMAFDKSGNLYVANFH